MFKEAKPYGDALVGAPVSSPGVQAIPAQAADI